MADIQDRLQVLHERIAHLPLAHHPHCLIAVSKFQPFEKIAAAYHLGVHHFGENYLQEALSKIETAQQENLPLIWHFIGKIQSNKTRPIAENFQWVHTIDRLKIAQRLNEQRPEHLPALNVCVQINLGNEENKNGVLPEQAQDLCLDMVHFPKLILRGLMAIPPATPDPHLQRHHARTLKNLADEIARQLPQTAQKNFNVLSIGMSDDLESALLEGATHIRVGSALFGNRAPISKKMKG